MLHRLFRRLPVAKCGATLRTFLLLPFGAPGGAAIQDGGGAKLSKQVRTIAVTHITKSLHGHYRGWETERLKRLSSGVS